MDLTPEQTRRIEENRKRALDRLEQLKSVPQLNLPKELIGEKNTTQSTPNAAASTDTVPSAPKQNLQSALTKRKYIDVDLTKITDTKAGFLLPEQSQQTTEQSRKKQVTYVHNQLPTVNLENPSENPVCKHCGTMTLDVELFQHYRVHVCTDCRNQNPDLYTLLTKTEAKEDYLLTDEELRDADKMPHWDRPNPRKNTYARMKLYLRCQVEEFAFTKWGGGEGLDKEWERRQEEKRKKKERDYRKKMVDLRNRTRTSLWQNNTSTSGKGSAADGDSENHQHIFVEEEDMMTGDSVERCRTCGKLRDEVDTD